MASSSNAASATLCVIGPVVSWRADSGTTPKRDVNPTVGLIPSDVVVECGTGDASRGLRAKCPRGEAQRSSDTAPAGTSARALVLDIGSERLVTARTPAV